MKKVITLEQAMAGKPIADPLNIYDCSLVSDGAASVVLVPSGTGTRVHGQARAGCSGSRRRPTTWRWIERTTSRRFGRSEVPPQRRTQMAGVGPKEIESPRCTTASPSPRSSRSRILGSFRKGRAGPIRPRDARSLTGPRPVNTSGGLKAKGHPVGATGVAQICDIVLQIRGEAGERQVTKHDIGLAQNLGGSGASCVVTILAAA